MTATSSTEDRSERALLLLTLTWIVGTPTLFVFGDRVLGDLPLVNFQRVFFLGVLVLLTIRGLRRPQLLWPPDSVTKAALAYLVVVLLSWSSTLPGKDATAFKQDADFLLGSFVMPLTAYVVARSIEWTRTRLVSGLWILAGGAGVYLALVGVAQVFYDVHFLDLTDAACVHCGRAKGPFTNSIPYGMVVSLLLLVSLFVFLQSRTSRSRGSAAALAVLLLEAIVLSKVRAIWLGMSVAMAFVAWRLPRARLLAVLVVTGLLGQILLSSIRLPGSTSDPSSPHSSTQPSVSMRARLTEIESIYDRVVVYTTDLNMIAHKPIFGFGFGLHTFQENKVAYARTCCGVPLKWLDDCHVPHNELLNVLILTGVVGLTADLFVVGAVLRLLAAPDSARHPAAAELSIFLQAGLIVLAITAMTHDLMYVSYVLLLVFFLLGIVAGLLAQRGADDARSAGR